VFAGQTVGTDQIHFRDIVKWDIFSRQITELSYGISAQVIKVLNFAATKDAFACFPPKPRLRKEICVAGKLVYRRCRQRGIVDNRCAQPKLPV
jgi:hypothetical protein